LGGVIFPGLQLSVASFYQNTPNQRDKASEKRDAYATSTAAAIGCGVRWAVTGGINELLRELFTQLPPTTPVLLTGGDAAELAPFLQGKIEQVPQLVFEGMALIAGFNQDD
jgi:type III pantothenate kinase